jgi:hypothetical protein
MELTWCVSRINIGHISGTGLSEIGNPSCLGDGTIWSAVSARSDMLIIDSFLITKNTTLVGREEPGWEQPKFL